MKPFKFLQTDKDIPTPQDIRNSPWLTGVFRQGWNARLQGIDNPPSEYRVSFRTLDTWNQGYWAARNEGNNFLT
jgi:hypothetical protein